MDRLMLFFTFSFFLFYNLINSGGNEYLYQPIIFVFVGVVTLFLTWSEVPKLTYRINRIKQLISLLIAYVVNLFIVLFVTNFGFAFYHQINFQSTSFFVIFYSLITLIFHLIIGPILIGLIELKIVQFLLKFSEETVIQEISKLSYQIFEEAKGRFAPQLSFQPIAKPITVFDDDRMYLYGAHHLFYKFPKRMLSVSRKKKLYHYEQLVKNLTNAYNPFVNSDQSIFTLSTDEMLDFYFQRLGEDYCLPVAVNQVIHPEVQSQLAVIRGKQEEFLNYMKKRYSQLKKAQTELLLDFVAEQELNRILKNIEGFKNLGDCFLKDIPLDDQDDTYSFKLLLTTKGIYLVYLVNFNATDKYQLMIDDNEVLSRISIHDDTEEPLYFPHLIENLVSRSDQLYYQIGLQSELLMIKKVGIQPILLLASNHQVIGELPDIQIIEIKEFKRELEKGESRLTQEELDDLAQLISQISKTEIKEELFDFEYELTHNIQVFGEYMHQITALIEGFKTLQSEIESHYKNKG